MEQEFDAPSHSNEVKGISYEPNISQHFFPGLQLQEKAFNEGKVLNFWQTTPLDRGSYHLGSGGGKY